jgi:hypothetical protein
MKSIGGFFELELPEGKGSYHPEAISLCTGRACLNLIIQITKPSKIYIPYYTCDTLIEPIQLNSIRFEYYPLNENLDPALSIELNENEYFIYINYFGIKKKTIFKLIKKYGNRLIVDNSQAFFEKKYPGILSFNSARKFFGVPDGAYFYSPFTVKKNFPRNTKIKINHLVNRMLGNQELSYKQFLENESLMDFEIRLMSLFSERILANVDYEKVIKKRRANFNYLHRNLVKMNKFNIQQNFEVVPFCYPFLPDKVFDKKIFHKRNIFIPTLWQRSISMVNEGFEFEKDFAERFLPLPVDQRLTKDDCDKLIKSVLKIVAKIN